MAAFASVPGAASPGRATPGAPEAGGTAHTATASLTVTPSVSASPQHAATAQASLAVTPSATAAAAAQYTATASLTITPSTSAQREHGATAAASLAVTPSPSATAARGHYRTASLTVTPSLSAARTVSHKRTASLTVTPSSSASPPPVFPANPLGIKVEILVNGTWEDISAYVQNRSDVVITRGLPDETQALTPSSMTLVLNNRDGRFSTNNPSGAYYPYFTRGVELRLSVDSYSATGVSYSGYRYWGEIASAPPTWDNTGNDVYVTLTVSGPFRRYVQSPVTGSPMALALAGLTGTLACIGLWPCEDGQYASQISSALPGGGAITFFSGTPDLASQAPLPNATLPLPVLNGSHWNGAVPTYTSNGNIVVRFIVDFASDVTTGDSWYLMQVNTTGTCAYLELVVYDPSDYSGNLTLGLLGYESNGSTVIFNSGPVTGWNDSGTTPGNPDAYWVSMEIRPVSGGKVQCSLILLAAGQSTGEEWSSSSFTGSVGDVTGFVVNPDTSAFDSTALGMISVQSGWESMFDFYQQLNAYSGETAAARLQRLCAQNNLNFTLVGSDTTPQMGPQQIDTLLNMMQSCMDMDRGILYESKAQLGVEYRTRESMQNQDAALVAYYGDAMLSQVPAPTADDQYIRNYVTMVQANGGSATVQLASGAMSVQYPPDGIGPYSYSQTVIAYSDSQLPNLATWVMDVGTVNEYRFPQLTFNLARPEVASLFGTIPAVDIGDFIQIPDPPAFLQSADINQLAWGYTENLNGYYWIIVFNTVPEDPYTGEDLPSW